MRVFLLFFGWTSLFGSLFDGLILTHAFWLAASGTADFSMTVDTHLRDHLSFLYWVKDVGYAILPAGFVDWIFGLNAFVYFPVRIIISVLVGGWALSAAKRMKPAAG